MIVVVFYALLGASNQATYPLTVIVVVFWVYVNHGYDDVLLRGFVWCEHGCFSRTDAIELHPSNEQYLIPLQGAVQ